MPEPHLAECWPHDTNGGNQHAVWRLTAGHPAGAAGFAQLFPVQAAAWRQLAGGHSQAHDLCISAPTGSGKTLAYALPVLSALIGCEDQQRQVMAVRLMRADLCVIMRIC